jgi:Arc/MetJ family transcription regulator
MRTNIDIDDKLMDFVMSTGDFKTKREAVEAGLALIKRRHAYAAIRDARGTLFWDDSDEAWARRRAEIAAESASTSVQTDADAATAMAELAVNEPVATYKADQPLTSKTVRKPRTSTGRAKGAVKGAAA